MALSSYSSLNITKWDIQSLVKVQETWKGGHTTWRWQQLGHSLLLTKIVSWPFWIVSITLHLLLWSRTRFKRPLVTSFDPNIETTNLGCSSEGQTTICLSFWPQKQKKRIYSLPGRTQDGRFSNRGLFSFQISPNCAWTFWMALVVMLITRDKLIIQTNGFQWF